MDEACSYEGRNCSVPRSVGLPRRFGSAGEARRHSTRTNGLFCSTPGPRRNILNDPRQLPRIDINRPTIGSNLTMDIYDHRRGRGDAIQRLSETYEVFRDPTLCQDEAK